MYETYFLFPIRYVPHKCLRITFANFRRFETLRDVIMIKREMIM